MSERDALWCSLSLMSVHCLHLSFYRRTLHAVIPLLQIHLETEIFTETRPVRGCTCKAQEGDACYIWQILRHLTHWVWHMPPISARCELFSINKNHAKNPHLRLLRPMPVCKPSSCMKVQIGVLNAFLMHPVEFPAQFVHPVRVASCRFRD